MSNRGSGQAVVRLDRDSAERAVAELNSSAADVEHNAGRLDGIGLGDFAPLFLRWADGTRECAAAVSMAIGGTGDTDRAVAAAVSRDMP